jgi:hypothetical protein
MDIFDYVLGERGVRHRQEFVVERPNARHAKGNRPELS